MDIHEILSNNICEVTFTKANGDERTMICTLMPAYLPQTDAPSRAVNTPVPDDLITVWDVEEDAWRSFKPSKIIDLQFSPE